MPSMWDARGYLIQVDYRSAVGRSFTAPDRRTIFEKLGHYFESAGFENIGQALEASPAPKGGGLLLDVTDDLQKQLWKGDKTLMPKVCYTWSTELRPWDVRVFYGLEEYRFSVEGNPMSLIEFLGSKAREYADVACRWKNRPAALSDAMRDVERDDYQRAFDRYRVLYVSGALAGDTVTIIRSLCDVANIRVRNAQLDTALLLAEHAIEIAEDPNLVDANLRVQAALCRGNILKLKRDHAESLGAYERAAQIALYAGDTALLFLSLCGLAEESQRAHNYELAIQALDEATELVLGSEEDVARYRVAFELQRTSNALCKQLRAASTPSPSMWKELLVRAVPAIIRSLSEGVVLKVFGVQGAFILASFGSAKFDLSQAVFKAPTQVGDGIQQVLHYVS